MRNCEKIGWQAKAPAPQGKVGQHSQISAACDEFVGRASWPAGDRLVDLREHRKSRTRGSGADGGVRPTFGLRLCCFVGQTLSSVVLLAVAAVALAPAALAQTGFPFQDESLHYNVNWPSGLSLGEATFTAHHKAGEWDLAMTLDSAIPGFAVKDKVWSVMTDDLCSTELTRDVSHGDKKTREKTTFDQSKGEATRNTVFPAGGGTSTFSTPGCPRDAMAFLYFARRELGQGRVAPAQQVFFGSSYSVRMDYTGAQTVTVSDKPSVTDHLVVHVKGPKSDFSFEMFFARDAARTPLLIRVPLSVGTFSMELVR